MAPLLRMYVFYKSLTKHPKHYYQTDFPTLTRSLQQRHLFQSPVAPPHRYPDVDIQGNMEDSVIGVDIQYGMEDKVIEMIFKAGMPHWEKYANHCGGLASRQLGVSPQ